MEPMEAGKGENHVYLIPSSSNDKVKLTARQHYVGVDAVAWFINKESGWFSKRMASGALDIQLASGLESYQVALGTFALKGGSRTAPVFEKPVVPDRNFRGGVLTFSASLSAIKKDTAVAGLLKSAADASLGVAAGMVDTATMAGPTKLLAAAGTDLLGGVRNLLQNSGEKREALFDFNGFEYTLRPEDVTGPEVYILLHRGSELDSSKLKIGNSGQLKVPFYGTGQLADGAWLLLRIRREDEYGGVRSWFSDTRLIRRDLANLVADVEALIRTKDDALEELKPSASGDKTIVDRLLKLRGVIEADGVVSEREAIANVSQLMARLNAARVAITKGDSSIYKEAVKNAAASLAKAERPMHFVASAMRREAEAVVEARAGTIVGDTKYAQVADFAGDDLYKLMKPMKKLQKEYSSANEGLAVLV